MTYQVCEGSSCCSSDSYDYMEQKLMKMAYWAHKQLLFDKLKQEIEKQEGEKFEKLAQLVVESMLDEKKSEKEYEKKSEELRNKIKEVFDE